MESDDENTRDTWTRLSLATERVVEEARARKNWVDRKRALRKNPDAEALGKFREERPHGASEATRDAPQTCSQEKPAAGGNIVAPQFSQRG